MESKSSEVEDAMASRSATCAAIPASSAGSKCAGVIDLKGGRLNGWSFHDLRRGLSEQLEVVAVASALAVVETGKAVVLNATGIVLAARKKAGNALWRDAWPSDAGENALAVSSWKARLVPHLQLRANMVNEDNWGDEEK